MKNYLQDFIDWMAQRLIVRATARAVEMLDNADRREAAPKALPAIRLPQIELHE